MTESQRALATSVGYVVRIGRGVLQVRGADRLSWLHSLTTQHLTNLAPWQGAEALVLSPQGHVEHHLVLADDGEKTWIDVEPGTAPSLREFLESMKFMLRVEVVDVTDYDVLTLVGPRVDELLLMCGVDGLGEAYACAPMLGGVARAMPWPAPRAVDVVVPRAALGQISDAAKSLGAVEASEDDLDALRVAERRPRFGYETDHRTIPHEVGWIGAAVHLDKGCYRGQETVARVHNLGRPPRRLVFLRLTTGVALPAHGDPVTVSDGSVVGFVGTAVNHYELGPIALALVKRNASLDDLHVAGGTVAAEPVVEGEPAVALPKLERLTRRG